MRRLIWAVLILALVWTGWWYWAAQTAEKAVAEWFDARRAEGWQAEYAGLEIAGFPMRFDAALRLPALADPDTGVAATTSDLGVSAPVWWPGDLTVHLPTDPITFASPQARANLVLQEAEAQMRVQPGAALVLERLSLTSAAWSLAAPLGEVLSAADLRAVMVQDEAEPLRYQITATAADLQPGPVPRGVLRVPDSWPVTFERFGLDMTVGFDRVWDRRAIEVSRPQPRRIDLRLAEAEWGTMSLRAAADLTVDPLGVPTGTMSLQARNWQDMLILAEASGALPSALVPQARAILSALAGATGDPNAIDVDLTLRDGLMLLGFVPIGAAPQLILR